MNSVLRSIDIFCEHTLYWTVQCGRSKNVICFFQTPYICVCYLALYSPGTCLAFSLHFLDLTTIQSSSAYVITDHRKHVSNALPSKSLDFPEAKFLCIHILNSMKGSSLTIKFKQNSLLKIKKPSFILLFLNDQHDKHIHVVIGVVGCVPA